jgi:hypothetical protein
VPRARTDSTILSGERNLAAGRPVQGGSGFRLRLTELISIRFEHLRDDFFEPQKSTKGAKKTPAFLRLFAATPSSGHFVVSVAALSRGAKYAD